MGVAVEGELHGGVAGEVLDVLGGWCMPRASRIVKQVCLRSCQRMEGTSARLSRGLK